VNATEEGRGSPVERTVLAWNRVAVAVAANGALVMRAGFVHDLVVVDALGVAIVILGVSLWTLSLTRYQTVAGRAVPHLFAGERGAVPPVASFVMLLSLLDLLIVVFAR
jgi:uncharacterized membrane protein YidH (DUF202 family)